MAGQDAKGGEGLISNHVKFEDLKGKTLVGVTGAKGDERMVFTCLDGDQYELVHVEDCCETVLIEDVCGDLSDLVGEVLTAEEVSSEGYPPPVSEGGYTPESYSWTFYRIGTARGLVTVRWLGESNGYYSESVTFRKVD